MISIIIPVHNEQKRIQQALDTLQALEAGHLAREVLVVQSPGEEYDVATIMAPAKGRAAQMNHGASLAAGEILLFLHADTALPGNALSLIATARTGAFSLRFASRKPLFTLLGLLATVRSRLLRLPYGDQAMFLPKADFINAGGFADVPILEDVLLAEKIRPRVLREYVVTSCRRYQKQGMAKTILRHRLIMLGHCLGMSPERLCLWRR